MMKGTQYIGTIYNEQESLVYQVDEVLTSYSGFAIIEFSQCIGDSDLFFIEHPSKPNKKADVKAITVEDIGRTFY